MTVCHAAGRAGTTKYVSITVSANGANAHFTNNGTPKAGHELDFLATAERPCNAPEAAQVKICKLSSANDPTTADPTVSFAFTTSRGDAFSLKFTECTEPADIVPGDISITEAADPNVPAAFSYFATSVNVANGILVNSSGFNATRPAAPQDAIVRVTTTSGNLTTVTFYNRN